jgi:hypothetical protein
LPWGIRTEGRHLLALAEELTQARVKALGGLSSNGEVARNRALLLGHLPWGVKTDDPRESGALEPLPGGLDLLVGDAQSRFFALIAG